jgi:glycosyltransferase involved in cell wall biosynthesis
MNCDYLTSALPHLVWVSGESLSDKLDAATWLETSSELCTLGWRVTLVVAGAVSHQSVRGVEVVCIAGPDVYLLRRVVFHIGLLGFLVRDWATIDVILFYAMSAPWVLPLLLVRRLKGRQRPLLVMDTRDVDIPSGDLRSRLRTLFLKFARRLANRWADGQTVITQRMADLVHIPSQQLWGTWPSGVDLARFAPAQDVRVWPSAEEPIRLIYIGALLPERNLLSLCQAVEEANVAGMRFVLTIVGKGSEQPELERFALPVTERIRVRPPVPLEQVPGLLAQAHVGVTSLFSPDDKRFQASSPIKLFEYMATGLPILATKIVCHTDVVGNGKFGFWAEDASVEGIFAALCLIWHARASLDRMGQEAAIAVQSWTWRGSATKLQMALERGLQIPMTAMPSCQEETRFHRRIP